MRRRLRALAFLYVITLLVFLSNSTLLAAAPSQAGQLDVSNDAPDVEAAVAERLSFGLSTDRAFIRSFLRTSTDVGSQRWGIPMTADEERALDLIGRMSYAQAVDELVLPLAREKTSYAGAYIDHARGGRLIILLTANEPAIERELSDVAPPAGILFEYAEHSLSQLLTAFERSRSAWRSLTSLPLVSVSVDERRNRLVFGAELGTTPPGLASALKTTLGVQVYVESEIAGVDASCTTSGVCYDPMRAGARIRQASETGPECTMSFHIIKSLDVEYLSAGHCGHTGSTAWYHAGFGFVGFKGPSQLVSPGRDIARFELPNAQVSNNIVNRAADVEGSGNPIQDEAVCAYLGNSDVWDCGVVADAIRSWTSPTCSCTVSGANASGLNPIGGDSGSPIMRQPNVEWYIGVGVLNQSNGNFAKLQESINWWGFGPYITD